MTMMNTIGTNWLGFDNFGQFQTLQPILAHELITARPFIQPRGYVYLYPNVHALVMDLIGDNLMTDPAGVQAADQLTPEQEIQYLENYFAGRYHDHYYRTVDGSIITYTS